MVTSKGKFIPEMKSIFSVFNKDSTEVPSWFMAKLIELHFVREVSTSETPSLNCIYYCIGRHLYSIPKWITDICYRDSEQAVEMVLKEVYRMEREEEKREAKRKANRENRINRKVNQIMQSA